jgi:tryptophan-rich sensory protein
MDFIQYKEYYDSLVKPFYSPPDWLFGVAWGIIYPLIAIYAVLLIISFYKKGNFVKDISWIFILNMIFNYAFTPVTLMFLNVNISLFMILLVLGSLVWLFVKSWKYSKGLTYILIPYLVWVSFATILSVHLIFLN